MPHFITSHLITGSLKIASVTFASQLFTGKILHTNKYWFSIYNFHHLLYWTQSPLSTIFTVNAHLQQQWNENGNTVCISVSVYIFLNYSVYFEVINDNIFDLKLYFVVLFSNVFFKFNFFFITYYFTKRIVYHTYVCIFFIVFFFIYFLFMYMFLLYIYFL